MKTLTLLATGLLAFHLNAEAATINGSFNDSSTVQPGGPRSGDNGKRYFNVEGSSNGTFASFGVVDFNISAVALGENEMISNVSQITLTFIQSNSGFTSPGTVAFYLSEDTSTDIQPGTSPLTYNGGNPTNGEQGFGTQLSPTHFLGDGAFTASGSSGSGTLDIYSFSIPISGNEYLTNLLTTGGVLRIIAAPTTATTAATWAAGDNSNGVPSISLTYDVAPIPEPATTAFLGLGAGFWLLGRRRRTA